MPFTIRETNRPPIQVLGRLPAHRRPQPFDAETEPAHIADRSISNRGAIPQQFSHRHRNRRDHSPSDHRAERPDTITARRPTPHSTVRYRRGQFCCGTRLASSTRRRPGLGTPGTVVAARNRESPLQRGRPRAPRRQRSMTQRHGLCCRSWNEQVSAGNRDGTFSTWQASSSPGTSL